METVAPVTLSPATYLIDPIYRCAYIHDGVGFCLSETNRLEIAGTPIFVPLDDLFARLD